MPRKKIKKFRATSVVKSMAREVLGSPPPVKRAENKKLAKKRKYQPNLKKMLSDPDQL